MTAYPKSRPVRDKAYRRWVATLPCINCGRPGPSQAAHGPTLGKSIKAGDDTCVPLCADGPGWSGCHSLMDQYKLHDRDARALKFAEWADQTRTMWAQKGNA